MSDEKPTQKTEPLKPCPICWNDMCVTEEDIDERTSRYRWACYDCNHEEEIGIAESAEAALAMWRGKISTLRCPPLMRRVTIQVVKPYELMEGDRILWASLALTVLQVDEPHVSEDFARVTPDPNEPELAHWLPRYMNFYKITHITEQWIDYLDVEGKYVTIREILDEQEQVIERSAFRYEEGEKQSLRVVECKRCGEIIGVKSLALIAPWEYCDKCKTETTIELRRKPGTCCPEPSCDHDPDCEVCESCGRKCSTCARRDA